MRQLLRDIFRDTIIKAKKTGVWERLTMPQKEALLSKSLLQHFKNESDPEQR